jgi:hypothetical protein
MKTKLLGRMSALVLLAAVAVSAAEPVAVSEVRVGVYDSRIVAFARFWSEAAGKSRDDLIAQARAAKAAGNQDKFTLLGQMLRELQTRDHLEIFSTAPADEAMAELQGKIPALLRELNVARLVSRWDESSLKALPTAERVDVTDRLVREFLPTPTDKQVKTIAELKKAEPVPLEKAKKLAAEGKL